MYYTGMQNTHHTPDRLTGLQKWAADFVCWVDYLRPRAYRLYCKVPGAYRFYKWCERHQ